MNGNKLWWSIDTVISRITKWALYVSIGCIAYMMAIATIDVITTKFFNCPIPSTSEFIEDLNIPLVYMGMAYVQLTKGHIVGSVFENKLSQATNRAIAIAGYIIGILVCGLLSWGGVVLIQEMLEIGLSKNSIIDFPIWPFALSLIISFVLMVLAYVLSIVRAVTGSDNREAEDITQA